MRGIVVIATVLSAVLVGGAAGARTDVPVGSSHKATAADWAELGEALAEVQATLAGAEAALTGDWWRYRECRFQSLKHATWTDREERLTTRCAVHKWLPGQLSKTFQVMSCESGMNRLARNGIYVGLFQHIDSAYPSRIHAFEPPAWDSRLSTRWTNSRAQIVMSVRMARAEGWSPWPVCGA
jgi:hypothetical protein